MTVSFLYIDVAPVPMTASLLYIDVASVPMTASFLYNDVTSVPSILRNDAVIGTEATSI
jgi:hypothetical protein